MALDREGGREQLPQALRRVAGAQVAIGQHRRRVGVQPPAARHLGSEVRMDVTHRFNLNVTLAAAAFSALLPFAGEPLIAEHLR